MKDLSDQVPGLAVTSQSGGNTLSDDPSLAMAAPGSPSVNPIPDRTDNLPLPELPAQHQMPNVVHGEGAARPDPYVNAPDIDKGAGWNRAGG